MSFKKSSLIVISLGILFFLSACLKREEPVELQPIQYFSTASCSLKIENIRYIFERDVREDIDCLEQNFESYIRIVRRRDDRYIHYLELKKFMQHFYGETRKVPDGIFESGFHLLSFLWGNADKKLPVDNIRQVFEFARLINRHVPPVLQEFRNENMMGQEHENYFLERDGFRKRLDAFGQEFGAFLDGGRGKTEKTKTINIKSLLGGMANGILSEDNIAFYARYGGIFKRMLVGGNPHEVKYPEFMHLLEKFPRIVIFFKDFMYLREQKSLAEAELLEPLLYEFFATFSSLLYKDFSKEEVLLAADQVSFFVNHFYPKFQYDQFEPHFVFLKNKILASKGEDWSYEDIVALLGMGRNIFGSIHFNRLSYRYYKNLKEYNIVLGASPPALDEYKIFAVNDVKEYWKSFKLIITGYRYFKKSHVGKDFQNEMRGNFSPLVEPLTYIDVDGYDEADRFDIIDELLIPDDVSKNLKILLEQNLLARYFDSSENTAVKTLGEIGVIRFFVSKLVEIYQQEGVVGKEEIRTCLEDFATLFKFLSVDIEVSDELVDYIFNQIDLLQFQSDGDGYAGVEEITEFASSLFFARRLAAKVYVDLRQGCPVDYDEEGGRYFFETDCYRKRFFTMFFSNRKYEIYFNGLLNDPVLMESQQKYWNYFLNLENLSKKRSEKNGKTMMDKEGLVRLILVFFNMEGVCDRLDPDSNGIVGAKEIGENYKIFRNFIYNQAVTLVPEWLLNEKMLKTIYLYIVEKGKKPKALDLPYYHLVRKEEDITTDREKISQTINSFL